MKKGLLILTLFALSGLTLIFLRLAYAQRIVVLEDGSTISISEDEVLNKKLPEPHVTFMEFTLGGNYIDSVIETLGKAKINKYIDYPMTGHSPIFICYTSALKNDNTTVVFEADDNSRYLSSFKIISKMDKYSAYNCSKSKEVNKEISTKGGLQLGMTKQQFIEILGPPSLIKENAVHYDYEYKEKYGRYDLYTYSFISANFQNGKLTELSISKSREI